MKKNISVDSGNEASSEDSNDSTTRLDFSTLQFTIVHLSALSTVHYYTTVLSVNEASSEDLNDSNNNNDIFQMEPAVYNKLFYRTFYLYICICEILINQVRL